MTREEKIEKLKSLKPGDLIWFIREGDRHLAVFMKMNGTKFHAHSLIGGVVFDVRVEDYDGLKDEETLVPPSKIHEILPIYYRETQLNTLKTGDEIELTDGRKVIFIEIRKSYFLFMKHIPKNHFDRAYRVKTPMFAKVLKRGKYTDDYNNLISTLKNTLSQLSTGDKIQDIRGEILEFQEIESNMEVSVLDSLGYQTTIPIRQFVKKV